MSGLTGEWMELIGGFIAFFLTLSVLSYALGDNFLFRIAIHIFVGASAGFAAVAAFYSILWPQLFRPMLFGSLDERLLTLVPLGLAVLLFCKTSPRFNLLGAPVMAFLTGVGGATIVAGALFGTLLPQIKASIGLFDPEYIFQPGVSSGSLLLNNILIFFGMIVTFLSFQYGVKKLKNSSVGLLWRSVARMGQVFIAITFGVIFAGVMTASITALVERFNFMVEFLYGFLRPG